MNVSRPLCSVCFREPREPNSGRCWDCGPGRIAPVPHRPRSKLELAEAALGAG
jgi:hypothetical protein